MRYEHGGDWAGFLEKYGTRPLDFSASVSPLGLPAGARAAAEAALAEADRYPDPLCRELTSALAAFHGVPADMIVCGAGAADLIHRLGRAVRPGRALIPVPAFSEYERALAPWGCEILRYTLTEKNGFKLDADFLSALASGPDLVILCEPANPTGLATDPALLKRILARCRELKILLAVDECFLPFLEDAEERSLISELGPGGLVIFRAFTKFYAMAGLRLGYCLTDEPGLAGKLAGCGQPWAVSGPAQAAGIAALRDAAYAKAVRKTVREQRAFLAEGLAGLGFKVLPGEANFLLFFSKDPALGEKLARVGILIRDCRNFPGLCPGWFRAAVRTFPENETLLKALGRCV
jgi:threonine-phosphate decarboxylase